MSNLEDIKARAGEATDGPWGARQEFITLLAASGLKQRVWWTLAVMSDHADGRGRVTLSKVQLASLLGTSERTIQRHWAAAAKAGFLTKHDRHKMPSLFLLHSQA